jgi:hypothetical protein
LAGAFFAAVDLRRRRRFTGAFAAVDFFRRRVVFRAVDFRAVFFARRFAGLRAAVLLAALLRAVRLFAGGTVTYLSLTVSCFECSPTNTRISGVHLLLEVGTH